MFKKDILKYSTSLVSNKSAAKGLMPLFSAGQKGLWAGGFDPANQRVITDVYDITKPVVGNPVGICLSLRDSNKVLSTNIGKRLSVADFIMPATGFDIQDVGDSIRIIRNSGAYIVPPYFKTAAVVPGKTYMLQYRIAAVNGQTAYTGATNGGGGAFMGNRYTSTGNFKIYGVATGAGDGTIRFGVSPARSAAPGLSIEGDYVDIDKNFYAYEVANYPLVQHVSASRPTLARYPKGGRRNRLNTTSNLTTWSIASASVSVSPQVGPIDQPVYSVVTASGAFGLGTPLVSVRHWSAWSIGDVITFSCYMKKDTARYGVIAGNNNGGGYYVVGNYDLENGTSVTYNHPNPVSNVSANMISVGDGWYRCSLTFTTNIVGANETSSFRLASSTTNASGPAGDGISGIFVSGPQSEFGNVPTPYQKVTTINDVTEAGVPSYYHLYLDNVDDAMTTVLPAGTYSRAYVTDTGVVTFDSLVSDGTTALSVLPQGRIADIVMREGTFSAMDKNLIYQEWSKYGAIGIESVLRKDIDTFWMSGSDPSSNRLFQDVDATTSVSTFGQPTGLVQRLAGTTNLQQATASARPTSAREPKGGRRNLLTWSEDFSNGAWVKTSATVVISTEVKPSGGFAHIITALASSSSYAIQHGPAIAGTLSFVVKKGTGRYFGIIKGSYGVNDSAIFDLESGIITKMPIFAGSSASIVSLGGGWYRCVLHSAQANTVNAFSAVASPNTINGSIVGETIYIGDAQFEQSPTVTPYQKVTTIYDVTEAGVPDVWSLRTDGTDDLMASTATFDVNKPWYFAVCAMIESNGGLTSATTLFGLAQGTTYLRIAARSTVSRILSFSHRHAGGAVTSTPSGTFNYGAPFIVEGWADGVNLYCSINGETPLTNPYVIGNTPGLASIQLAAGNGIAPTRYYDALAIQRIPSDAERAALRAEWTKKYLTT